MTLWERYQQDLKKDGFYPDKAQEKAVRNLQALADKLVEQENQRQRPLQRLRDKLRRAPQPPVQGLYFWGGVGRGKTYLMDTFFESLPIERKMRVHFHRFMQRVHNELRQLRGAKNPLDRVGERFSEEASVICFDEFFVSDIGDAMILAGLLRALFNRGTTLVCTSNIVPDGLYKDGLQRARFLPAIALLNEHLKVINVDGGVDYRLRTLQQADLYYHPLGDQAQASLERSYRALAVESGCQDLDLDVNGRTLKAHRHAEDVVWFDFRELCDGPRSTNDYIELAREFHAIIVSNVPVMGRDSEDQARRFINMVDEFYDRRVKLIVSAAAPINGLYEGKRLQFEFERTESRLLEMQSQEYLESAHLA